MSRLQLVTDPTEHQYREAPGVMPGTTDAPCASCGETAPQHIARQCGAGWWSGPRCELDATYVVPFNGRRIPFCPECAGMTIDLALAFGLTLVLEPLPAGGSA